MGRGWEGGWQGRHASAGLSRVPHNVQRHSRHSCTADPAGRLAHTLCKAACATTQVQAQPASAQGSTVVQHRRSPGDADLLLPVRSGGRGGRRRSMPPMSAGALMRSSSGAISEGGGAVVPMGAPAMKKAEA